MADHRLLNADRAGPRKAHCSCGWWSPSALATAAARRAAHRDHRGDPMAPDQEGPTS